MAVGLPAQAVVDRYFLEMRAKVLDVAAALDRIDGAEGAEPARRDGRLRQLREAVSILLEDRCERAKRVQMIFSDAYTPDWPRPGK